MSADDTHLTLVTIKTTVTHCHVLKIDKKSLLRDLYNGDNIN